LTSDDTLHGFKFHHKQELWKTQNTFDSST
jgi:hypothetical protein